MYELKVRGLLHVHWISVMIHCTTVALVVLGLFECMGSHRLVVAVSLPMTDDDASGMNRSKISNGEHSLHDMYPMRLA